MFSFLKHADMSVLYLVFINFGCKLSGITLRVTNGRTFMYQIESGANNEYVIIVIYH